MMVLTMEEHQILNAEIRSVRCIRNTPVKKLYESFDILKKMEIFGKNSRRDYEFQEPTLRRNFTVGR